MTELISVERGMLMAINRDIKREAMGLSTTVRAVDATGNIFRPIAVRMTKRDGWKLYGKRITDGEWIGIAGWHNY